MQSETDITPPLIQGSEGEAEAEGEAKAAGEQTSHSEPIQPIGLGQEADEIGTDSRGAAKPALPPTPLSPSSTLPTPPPPSSAPPPPPPPPPRSLTVRVSDVYDAVDSFRFYYNAVIEPGAGGNDLGRGHVVCKMLMVADVPVLVWSGSIASLSQFITTKGTHSPSALITIDLVPTTLEPVRWISSRSPENHVMWVVASADGVRFDDVHVLGSFLISRGINEHVLYRIPHVYEFRMRGMGRLPSDEIVAMRASAEDVAKWVRKMGDATVLTKHLQSARERSELGQMWVDAFVAGKLRPGEKEVGTADPASSSSSSSSTPGYLESAAAAMRTAMSELTPVLRRTPIGVLAQHPDMAHMLAMTRKANADPLLAETRITPIKVSPSVADYMLRSWKGSEPWTSTENVRAIMGAVVREARRTEQEDGGGDGDGHGGDLSILDVLASWEEKKVLHNPHPEITSITLARTLLTCDSVLRTASQCWKWIILNHGAVEETNVAMLPVHYPIEAVIQVMRDPEIPVGWFSLLGKDVPQFVARRAKQLGFERQSGVGERSRGEQQRQSRRNESAPTAWMERAAAIVRSQPDVGLLALWEVLRDVDMAGRADDVIDMVEVLRRDTPPPDTTATDVVLLCSIFYAPHLFNIRGRVAQYLVSRRDRLNTSFRTLAEAFTDSASAEIHPLGSWRVGQVYEWLAKRRDPFRIEEDGVV